MKSRLFGLLLFLLTLTFVSIAQETIKNKDHYFKAKNEIVDMLEGKIPLSYERAIYLIENAWWDGELDDDLFDAFIANGVNHIKTIEQQSAYIYLMSSDPKPFNEVLKDKSREDAGFNSTARINFAIYTYLTDTLKFVRPDSTLYTKYPYTYSHADPFGTVDWKNTQVNNLLWNGEGNCFALVSLYKIFSERLHSDADICTAPGHVYISHKDNKGTQFNIELATRSFPGTGTIATLSYTTMDAIKNGISLRQLTTKQAVALTLVYLAKGYENKFSQQGNTDSFLLDCVDLALHYDSLNLNAMLLKSEVLERVLISEQQPIEELRSNPVFQEYQSHIQKLYFLGYREMPKEMKDILVSGWMKDTVTQLAQQNYLKADKLKSRTNRTSYASLSWGLFDEVITTKPVEQFGSTLFDTKTKAIKGFVLQQQRPNSYTFDPVLFAWNIDPLAHKAPGWNPYRGFFCNPIIYVDPDGRFEVPASVQKAYPMFTTYLKSYVEKDVMRSQVLLDAFYKNTAADNQRGIGNLTESEVRKAVKWNSGPKIEINDAPGGNKNASGYYKQKEGVIQLNKDRIGALEKILADNSATHMTKQKALTAVFMTLTHETVHYGDFLDGVQQMGEPGVDFEDDVWRTITVDSEGEKVKVKYFFGDKYNPDDMQQIIDTKMETKEGRETLPTVPTNSSK